MASAEYWQAELDEPVELASMAAAMAAGMAASQKQGCGVFLEVGPRSALAERTILSLKDPVGLWLPGLSPVESDWPAVLKTLAQLYARGVRINWEGFDRDFRRRRLSLPTYPFQRQRFWIDGEPVELPQNCPSSNAALPTAVVRLLSEGKIDELAATLNSGQTFSDEEARLLPKVLQALADQHCQQSSAPVPQPGV